MPFFGHNRPRDIAGIYSEQTRSDVDRTTTPVFPPDQALAPGDVAVIQNGQFVRGGTVRTRGLEPSLAPESQTAAWSYATSGSLEISPSGHLSNPLPGGADLLTAKLTLKSDRSVVASFGRGCEQRVADAQQFGTALMQMWFARQLRPDELVVWSARQATGATVIVSAEGGNEIELSANSALLGGLGITLDGLSAGVHFGTQKKSSYHVSDPAITFTTSVRAFWLPPDARAQIDHFGFSDDPDSIRSAAADFSPIAFTAANYLNLLDADELPEEDQLL